MYLPLTIADSCIDLYADESSLYKTGKHIQDVQINLQHNVGQVAKLCKKNNMSLNLIKPSKWSCVIRVDCL